MHPRYCCLCFSNSPLGSVAWLWDSSHTWLSCTCHWSLISSMKCPAPNKSVLLDRGWLGPGSQGTQPKCGFGCMFPGQPGFGQAAADLTENYLLAWMSVFPYSCQLLGLFCPTSGLEDSTGACYIWYRVSNKASLQLLLGDANTVPLSLTGSFFSFFSSESNVLIL